MSRLPTRVRPSDPEFRANAAHMERLVTALRAARARGAEGGAGGSEEARRRHTARGKLLVRERIARLLRPAEGGARPRRPQPRHQPLHVGGVGAELGIGRADPGREPAHQKSERRAARPSASMVAIRAFTCSTFSPITSSSSLGFPVKRIGSPK